VDEFTNPLDDPAVKHQDKFLLLLILWYGPLTKADLVAKTGLGQRMIERHLGHLVYGLGLLKVLTANEGSRQAKYGVSSKLKLIRPATWPGPSLETVSTDAAPSLETVSTDVGPQGPSLETVSTDVVNQEEWDDELKEFQKELLIAAGGENSAQEEIIEDQPKPIKKRPPPARTMTEELIRRTTAIRNQIKQSKHV